MTERGLGRGLLPKVGEREPQFLKRPRGVRQALRQGHQHLESRSRVPGPPPRRADNEDGAGIVGQCPENLSCLLLGEQWAQPSSAIACSTARAGETPVTSVRLSAIHAPGAVQGGNGLTVAVRSPSPDEYFQRPRWRRD